MIDILTIIFLSLSLLYLLACLLRRPRKIQFPISISKHLLLYCRILFCDLFCLLLNSLLLLSLSSLFRQFVCDFCFIVVVLSPSLLCSSSSSSSCRPRLFVVLTCSCCCAFFLCVLFFLFFFKNSNRAN